MVYFGAPDEQHHCAYAYQGNPSFRCPDYIDFVILVPGQPDRPACFDHLGDMICETPGPVTVIHRP